MAESRSNRSLFTDDRSFGDGDNEAHAGNKKEYIVDIDKWAASLAKILEDVPQYMCSQGHPGRIGRIPENLREVDMRAYEPYVLSIGPYHHGKPRFEKLEKRKLMLLKYFLEHKPDLTLTNYLMEIKSVEPQARRFYSDVEMESDKFTQMLLLDSLYMITVFCGMPNTGTGSKVDEEDMNETVKQADEGMSEGDVNQNTQIITSSTEKLNDQTRSGGSKMPRWFWPLFLHDIFLLENQLPLFVLQKIHALVYGGTEAQLISILRYKVGNMLSKYTKPDSKMMIMPTEEVHHFLHVCHLFFRPTLQHEHNACPLPKSSQMFRLGNVVQLYKEGVNFKTRPDTTEHSLLDITFSSSGKMVMPCLHVDDNTISLLRNLIALEQMKYPSIGLHVSAYVVLLLHLITTTDDVKLLRRKGIIQHHLSSDKEMMFLINRLSVGLSFDYVEDDYSLKPIFEDLRRYTDRRVPRWRAWLKHRYCSIPWAVISLLAASLLLLLSIVQTYYTVYSYYNPQLNGHS